MAPAAAAAASSDSIKPRGIVCCSALYTPGTGLLVKFVTFFVHQHHEAIAIILKLFKIEKTVLHLCLMSM